MPRGAKGGSYMNTTTAVLHVTYQGPPALSLDPYKTKPPGASLLALAATLYGICTRLKFARAPTTMICVQCMYSVHETSSFPPFHNALRACLS